MKIKKAAVFTAAFFVCGSVFSQNTFAILKSENYKDLIEKAQNLILQKDRAQALTLLGQALKQEGHKSAELAEIKKQISFISRLFLVEKAQQDYELAISIRKQDPAQAINKINEALKVEPDNLNLLLELARLQIIKNDCGAAQEAYNKIHKALILDEEINLLQSQILFCGSGKEGIQNLKNVNFEKKSTNFELYWTMLEIKKCDLNKNELRIKELLKTLATQKTSHYPELVYWQWKILPKTDPNKASLGQKYILSCQGLSQKQVREFLADPYLCGKTQEVELEMKKGVGSDI